MSFITARPVPSTLDDVNDSTVFGITGSYKTALRFVRFRDLRSSVDCNGARIVWTLCGRAEQITPNRISFREFLPNAPLFLDSLRTRPYDFPDDSARSVYTRKSIFSRRLRSPRGKQRKTSGEKTPIVVRINSRRRDVPPCSPTLSPTAGRIGLN